MISDEQRNASDLHAAIMNIPVHPAFGQTNTYYRMGHEFARNAAAKLASEFVASLPGWYDRPTGPGLWHTPGAMVQLQEFTESDLREFPRMFEHWPGGRVFGPIPADSKVTP